MVEQTFGNEERLPRIPLPELADSAAALLESCTPLLSRSQLAETERAVRELLRPGGAAERLHSALQDYDNSPGVDSWLDEFWQARHLGRRDPIALNANFFFLFADSPLSQNERAAKIIGAAVGYKLALDKEAIAPSARRGQPSSMVQHKALFSATRIPGPVQDTVRAPYTPQWPGHSEARHIVVFSRGGMHRLDVVGADGQYSEAELAAALDEIAASPVTNPAPVGNFTALPRSEWAAWRPGLLETNEAAFEILETALFAVCLDEQCPTSDTDACDQLLAGDSANRWFDKALSFIVFADGRAGINVEHCGLDGTTVLEFCDAILTAPALTAGAGEVPATAAVAWQLDEAQRAAAKSAGAGFTELVRGTATATIEFGFGASQAKGYGVSPDGFAQMAYQLAHQRAKGHTGTTYESIAIRQYRSGRTIGLRSVTPEVQHFVAAMDDPQAPVAGKAAAFRAAALRHTERAKQCQAGVAPERHLAVLQLIQQRRGAELNANEQLAIFNSPGWTILRDDYLSTSSAGSANIKYFGFGPTTDHCIAVGYIMLADRWSIYLSTPRSAVPALGVFADEVRRAVTDLVALCEHPAADK